MKLVVLDVLKKKTEKDGDKKDDGNHSNKMSITKQQQ